MARLRSGDECIVLCFIIEEYLLDLGYFGASLEEMAGEYGSLSEQAPVVLDLADSLELLVEADVGGFDVGVARALVHGVADLLAAVTPEVLEVLLLGLLGIGVRRLVLVVVLALVLAYLATIRLLGRLATTPPHLSVVAPLRLMRLARPVEVLLL